MFVFDEPDHEAAVLPPPATSAKKRRSGTPSVRASDKKRQTPMKPAEAQPTTTAAAAAAVTPSSRDVTPPRRSLSAFALSRRASTPPRLGGFGSPRAGEQIHHTLSPIIRHSPTADTTSGQRGRRRATSPPTPSDSLASSDSPPSRHSTPTPAAVWERVLKRDVSRLVAPMPQDQLEAALAGADQREEATAKGSTPGRKRKSTSSAGVEPSPVRSIGRSPAASSRSKSLAAAGASSPARKKRRLSSALDASTSSQAAPVGRRSHRLEHEPKKSMREVESDDQEEEEQEESKSQTAKDDEDVDMTIEAKPRRRGASRSAAHSRSTQSRTVSSAETTGAADALVEKMRAFYADLDATPLTDLVDVRESRGRRAKPLGDRDESATVEPKSKGRARRSR